MNGLGTARGEITVEVGQAVANIERVGKSLDNLGRTGTGGTSRVGSDLDRINTSANRTSQGVNQYSKSVQQAGQSTGQFTQQATRAGTAVDNLARGAGRATNDLGQIGTNLSGLGRDAALLGTAVAVPFIAAGAAAIGFESDMAAVNAVMDASDSQMDALGDTALRLGKDTTASASDAAKGIEAMGKAGVSAEDILGGAADAAVALSEAGGIEVAGAAEIMSAAMNQFGIAGTDAIRVADLLAGAANSSLASVQDLGSGLAQVGGVANGLGVPIEEVVTQLAIMTDQGLSGSDAATSLKTAMTQLVAPIGEGAKEMGKLGISFTDANGEFIGIEESARLLISTYDDLNLGTAEQVASLKKLVGADGYRALQFAMQAVEAETTGLGKSWADYADQVTEVGAAQKVAEERMDSTQGALDRLGGAFETLGVTMGAGIATLARPLIEALDAVISKMAEAPPAVQAFVGVTGLLAGGATAAGGAALLLAGQVAQSIDALRDFGGVVQAAGGVLPFLAQGLTAVGSAMKAGFLAVATNPLILALTALAGLAALVVNAHVSMQQAAADQAAAYDELKAKIDATADAETRFAGLQGLIGQGEGRARYTGDLANEYETYIQRLEDAQIAQMALDYDTGRFVGTAEDYESAIIDLQGRWADYRLTVEEARDVTQLQSRGWDLAGDHVKQYSGALAELDNWHRQGWMSGDRWQAMMFDIIDAMAYAGPEAEKMGEYLAGIFQDVSEGEYTVEQLEDLTNYLASSTELPGRGLVDNMEILATSTAEADREARTYLDTQYQLADGTNAWEAALGVGGEALAANTKRFEEYERAQEDFITQQNKASEAVGNSVKVNDAFSQRMREVGMEAAKAATLAGNDYATSVAAGEEAMLAYSEQAAELANTLAGTLLPGLDGAAGAFANMVPPGSDMLDVLRELPTVMESAAAGAVRMADNISDAGQALDRTLSMFGTIDQLGQRSEGAAGIAAALVGAPGEWAAIDDAMQPLMWNYDQMGMLTAESARAQDVYNAALEAGAQIQADNVAVQNDLNVIRANQLPLLAEQQSAYADYIHTLSQASAADQQRALYLMDAGNQAKLAATYSTAYAASVGEIPETVATELIASAAQADPILKSTLLDMGLIEEGANGTITVNFPAGNSVQTTIESLRDSVNYLNDTIIAIHLEMNGDSEVSNRLTGAEQNVEDLDGRTATVNLAAAFGDDVIKDIESGSFKNAVDELNGTNANVGVTVTGEEDARSVMQIVNDIGGIEPPAVDINVKTTGAGESASEIENVGSAAQAANNTEVNIPLNMDDSGAKSTVAENTGEVGTATIALNYAEPSGGPMSSADMGVAQELAVRAVVVLDSSAIDDYTPGDITVAATIDLDTSALDFNTTGGKASEIKIAATVDLDTSEVDGYTPADKTMKVTVELDSSAASTFNAGSKGLKIITYVDDGGVQGFDPGEKEMTITTTVDSAGVDNYTPPTKTMTIRVAMSDLPTDQMATPTGGTMTIRTMVETSAVDSYVPPDKQMLVKAVVDSALLDSFVPPTKQMMFKGLVDQEALNAYNPAPKTVKVTPVIDSTTPIELPSMLPFTVKVVPQLDMTTWTPPTLLPIVVKVVPQLEAGNAGNIGAQIVQSAAAGMGGAAGTMQSAFGAVVSATIASGSGAAAGAGVVGTAFTTAAGAGIGGGTGTFTAAGGAMVQAGISAGSASAAGASAIGTAFTTAAGSGIGGGTGTLTSAVSAMVAAGISAGEGAAAGASSIGAAISSGAAAGIDVTALVGPAVAMVEAAITAANNRAASASPSRVFMEIGGFFSEGAAIGMTDNIPMVAQASTNMVDSAIEAARGRSGRGRGVLDGLFGDIDGIGKSAREIASVGKNLSNVPGLSDWGDAVSGIADDIRGRAGDVRGSIRDLRRDMREELNAARDQARQDGRAVGEAASSGVSEGLNSSGGITRDMVKTVRGFGRGFDQIGKDAAELRSIGRHLSDVPGLHDWGEQIEALADDIRSNARDGEKEAREFGKSLEKTIRDQKAGIKSAVDEVGSSADQAMGETEEGIAAGAMALAEKYGVAIGDYTKQLAGSTEEAYTAGTEVGQAGAEGVADGLDSGMAGATESVGQTTDALNQVAPAAADAGQAIGDMANQVGQAADSLAPVGQELTNSLGTGMQAGVPDVAQIGQQTVQRILEVFGNSALAGSPQMEQIGQMLSDAFGVGVSSGEPVAADAGAGLVDAATTGAGQQVGQATNQSEQWGRALGGGLEDGLNSTARPVQSAAQSLVQQDFLNGLEIGADRTAKAANRIGTDAGSNLVGGIQSQEKPAERAGVQIGQITTDSIREIVASRANAVRDSVDKMVGTATNINARSKTTPVGVDFVGGMVEGLNNEQGSLYNAVQKIVQEALKTAKNEAQTASPSRATMEIGQDMGAGFVVGLDSTAGAVQNSMAGLVGDAVTGAGAATSALDTTGFGQSLGSDIATGLDRASGEVRAAAQDLVTGDFLNGLEIGSERTTKAANRIGVGAGDDLVNGIQSQERMAQRAGTAIGEITTDSIRDMVETKTQAVRDSVTRMVDRSGDVNAKSAMQPVGQDFIGGMIGGLNNKQGDLYETVNKIVKEAIAEAKNAAKSKSPSRETMAVGEDMGVGLAIGVDNTAAVAANSMANLVSGVLDASSLDQVNLAGQMMDQLPGVRAAGDRLTDAITSSLGGTTVDALTVRSEATIDRMGMALTTSLDRIDNQILRMNQGRVDANVPGGGDRGDDGGNGDTYTTYVNIDGVTVNPESREGQLAMALADERRKSAPQYFRGR